MDDMANESTALGRFGIVGSIGSMETVAKEDTAGGVTAGIGGRIGTMGSVSTVVAKEVISRRGSSGGAMGLVSAAIEVKMVKGLTSRERGETGLVSTVVVPVMAREAALRRKGATGSVSATVEVKMVKGLTSRERGKTGLVSTVVVPEMARGAASLFAIRAMGVGCKFAIVAVDMSSGRHFGIFSDAGATG